MEHFAKPLNLLENVLKEIQPECIWTKSSFSHNVDHKWTNWVRSQADQRADESPSALPIGEISVAYIQD